KQSVHRVVVVEQERFHPVLRKWLGNESIIEESTELRNKFGREQFVDAISSLLYGTLLSKRNLTTAAASTLFAKLNPAWEAGLQDVKLRPSLVERSHKWLYTTGYYGKEKVESLETPAARESIENPEQPTPPIIKQAKRRGPSELSQDWLEG